MLEGIEGWLKVVAALVNPMTNTNDKTLNANKLNVFEFIFL